MIPRCKRDRGRFTSHSWNDDSESITCDKCEHVLSEGISYVTRKVFAGILKKYVFDVAPVFGRLKASGTYYAGDMVTR